MRRRGPVPERERFSDPDASWGHRSAVSTRAAGSFYGFKIHAAVCTATGLPLAWQIETAKRQESLLRGFYGYKDIIGDDRRRANLAALARELTARYWPAPAP